MSSATEAAPWWASFPEPKASCATIENTEVFEMLEKTLSENKDAQRKYLLVDVRRNDWEGGTIATSINLPAQSLYPTRPIVYQLCKQAGIEQIMFYCGECSATFLGLKHPTNKTGSSTGRGTRCASWMQDYLDEVGETGLQSIILKGGIKGWHKTFGGKMMDAHDAEFWKDKE